MSGSPQTFGADKLSRFCLQQGSPEFRFNEKSWKYQKRDNDGYRDIEHSEDVAVLEKRSVRGQVVFLAHGFGEEQTKRAVRHLITHWEKLYKQYGKQEFAIRV